MVYFLSRLDRIREVENQLDNLNKSGENKGKSITPPFLCTTTDVTRFLNSVPKLGHSFAPKSKFQQLKTALSIRIF